MSGEIAIRLEVNHKKYGSKLKKLYQELKRQKAVIVDSAVDGDWHTILAKAVDVLPVKRNARAKVSKAKAYSEPHGGAKPSPEKLEPETDCLEKPCFECGHPLKDHTFNHEAVATFPPSGSGMNCPEPVEVESGAAVLVMAEYSEKALIISGDTKSHAARIKNCVPKAHGIWHRKAGGWLFSKKHEPALRAALSDLLAA